MSQFKDELEKAQADKTASESAETLENKESSELGEDESKTTDETTVEETVEEEEKSESEEEPQEAVDYKKQLEEEKARRERAEKKVVELKKSNKSSVDVDEVISIAKQALKEEFESQKAEEIDVTTSEILAQIATSPEEKELIEFHYANTINKSGYTKQSIYQDLTRAKLLANEQKLIKQNAELKKALISKSTISAPSFAGTPIREGRNPLNAAEKALVAGLTKGMKVTEADIIKKLKK